MNFADYKIVSFFLYPAIALIISLILTRICISILPSLGMLAFPGKRRIHDHPVPTGGGIAIVASFFISIAIYFFITRPNVIHDNPSCILCLNMGRKLLIPIAVLIIGGILDDRFALRMRYKIVIQIIVGFICWYNGIAFSSILGIAFPAYISLLVTVLWIFSFMNAFNLIDGIDGLAGGLGIVASICMGAVFIISGHPSEAVLMLCLGAACLGFLRYNFSNAKLFMGETGSTFIGFSIAVIGIVSVNKALTLSAVLIPILAVGIPLIDIFLAVWRRSAKLLINKGTFSTQGNWKFFTGDREHIHHRLLDKGFSQRKTTLFLYCLASIFGLMAVILVLVDSKAVGIVLVFVLVIVVSIIRRLAEIEIWSSAKVALLGLYKSRSSYLVSLLHPLFDAILIFLALIITNFIFCKVSLTEVSFAVLYRNISFSLLPVVLVLHISGIYRVFWQRVTAGGLIFLLNMIFLGALLGFILSCYFTPYSLERTFIPKYILFFLITSIFILFERICILHIKFLSMRLVYRTLHSSDKVAKVLLYGGGLNTQFYLSKRYYNMASSPIKIIGIIDDELILRKQYVYNYKVLGYSAELPKIFKKYKFDKIIITTENISQEKRFFVEEFCKDNGVELSKVCFYTKEIVSSNC